MYYYGIDLGTTYSCIARANEKGEVEVIQNLEGTNTTPSVAEFTGVESRSIGETAKGALAVNPKDVVQFIKREMGKTDYKFTFEGKDYTPEEISSYIIKKLVHDAEELTGDEITKVVITVPAYFGNDQRKATEQAGEIAGLEVLSLINEPTAAVLDYGRRMYFEGKTQTAKTVLVYDLGGGTFDVTMAKMDGNDVEVICTDGDSNLGGKDWDKDLADYVIAEFCKETDASEKNVRSDSAFFYEVMKSVETAKKHLSSRDNTVIPLNMGNCRARITITKDKFNSLTRKRLVRTISLTDEVIKQAKSKGYDDYDEIILVGGSTRMSQVKDEIVKEYGKETVRHDPDEAVAKGAALMAKIIDGGGQGGGGITKVKDVTGKNYGIGALDNNGVYQIYNIIMQNTPTPCSATDDTFCTRVNDQRGAEIEVYESNSKEEVCDLDYGKLMTKGELLLPPGLPKDTKLAVTCTIDQSGMLIVTAVEGTSGNEVKIKVDTSKSSGLAKEEVKKMQRESEKVSVG